MDDGSGFPKRRLAASEALQLLFELEPDETESVLDGLHLERWLLASVDQDTVVDLRSATTCAALEGHPPAGEPRTTYLIDLDEPGAWLWDPYARQRRRVADWPAGRDERGRA